MSSKRAVRRRSCLGKTKYASREEAQRIAGYSNAREREGNGWIITYHCKFCGNWHIGHATKRVRKIFHKKGLR